MGRGTLLALLGLDLLVMGTSGFVLWDRIRQNFFAPSPVISQTNQPSSDEPPASSAEAQAPQALKPAPKPKEEAPKQEEAETANASHEVKKIVFQYRDPFAKRVSIAGDFNDWSPRLMKKDSSSKWTVTLELKPGKYAYNFVVDGKRIRDPSRKETVKKSNQKVPASVIAVKAAS